MKLTKEILDECCESLPKYSYNCIERADKDNGFMICKYMLAMKAEKDLSVNYRKAVIANLSRLSQFHKNKPFKSMVKQDVISFLNEYRKSDVEDPLQQWKGTYNSLLTYLISFFNDKCHIIIISFLILHTTTEAAQHTQVLPKQQFPQPQPNTKTLGEHHQEMIGVA